MILSSETAHPTPHPGAREAEGLAELLLRETVHRCSNDLQLVIGLLSLQARRTRHAEAREVLQDAADRVGVLARARAASLHHDRATLGTALRQVCEALHAQAEPRSILLSLEVADGCDGLDGARIPAVALAVNELATNAIKHAFEADQGGHIRIFGRCNGDEIVVTVDDDGLPFPEPRPIPGEGLGLNLAKRIIQSNGGSLRPPQHGSKIFEIAVPRD